MDSLPELVKQNFVVIFTTRHSVDCAKAKELISHFFTDVRIYDVDAMPNGEAIRQQVNELYSRSKVPAIFINGDFVGDLADLLGLVKSGVLKMRIKNWKQTCPENFPASPVTQKMTAVADMIGKNDVVVFSWVHCPFCVKAKQILAPIAKDMKVYEIDEMPGGADMKAQIEKTYNHDTVPAVFIHGQFIGGCDSVQALQKEGKLESLINPPQ